VIHFAIVGRQAVADDVRELVEGVSETIVQPEQPATRAARTMLVGPAR
jgi:hypothetical protein